MEPRADFYRILRKLFVPFHIKIPLELAGAATMVILVISVLNVQQVGKQETLIPEVATFKRFDRAPDVVHEAPALSESVKRPAPVFDPTMVRPTGDTPIVLARKSLTKSVQPDFERKLEPTPPTIEKAVSKQPVWTGQSIELALLLKTGASGRGDERGAAMEAAPPIESDLAADEEERTDIASLKKRTLKQQAGTVSGIQREDLKEESRSLLPQTPRGSALKDDSKPSLAYSYREDSLSRVKHIIRSVGGRTVSVKNETPPSIDAEIPFERYELFCEKLGRLGTFRNPPPGLADNNQETIRIQITLISSE